VRNYHATLKTRVMADEIQLCYHCGNVPNTKFGKAQKMNMELLEGHD